MRQLWPARPKVESGLIRFGNDWPGVYLRNEDARALAIAMERVLPEKDLPASVEGKALKYFAAMLKTAHVGSTSAIEQTKNGPSK